MDTAALQKLAGNIENGKKRSLNTFLGCSDYSPIANTLNSSPTNAKALLERYQLVLNSDGASPPQLDTLSRLQIFQALLMIYPSYETPWYAIADLTSRFVTLQADEAFHCVSAIELFLDNIRTEISASSVTVLEVHVPKWVDRLWKQTQACSRELRVLIGDLLLGILQFSKLHLTGQCNEHIFESVAKVQLSAETFPIWLEFFQKFSAVLPSDHLDLGRDCAMEFVMSKGNELSLVSCCSIVDSSFCIAKTNSSWCRLPIQLLVATHERKGSYVKLEQHIERCLRRLSKSEFETFSRFYDSETISPEWVRLSILIMLCRTTEESTAALVEELFSSALNVSACSIDKDHSKAGDKVLDYLFHDEEIMAQLELNAGDDNKFLIVEVLDDLTYACEGLVVDPDGSKVNSLSNASKLLVRVICCGTSDNDHLTTEEIDLVVERSLNLLFLAESFLEGAQDFGQIKATLFFALCVTIMYSTNCPDRDEIVDHLFQGLKSKSDSQIRKNACIATVGLIIRSVNSPGLVEDIRAFLEPCMALLDGRRIDTATFMHVATFMAGCDITREAVLKCSENILSRNHASTWGDGDKKSGFYADEIRAGLFGLLELLRSASWGDLEIRAWRGFSDCLVLNKPQIDVADRKWLYEQITESILDDESGSSTAVCHFLRATIARLGIFMVRETLQSSLRFVPENAFIVWEDPSTSVTQTMQVEDIFRLIRLSLFLVFQGVTRRGEATPSKFELKSWDVLSRCAQRLAIPKSNDRRYNSMSIILSAWLDASETDTVDVSFAALLGYLGGVHDHLVHAQGHSQNFDAGNRSDDTLVLKRCFNMILEQEKHALASGDQTAVISFPSWLRRADYDLFGTREIDVDLEWLTSLNLSLCDLLLENIGGHYLRRLPTDLRSLSICTSAVQAVGSLLELRRDLLDKEQSTAADSNVGLDSQTIAHTSTPFFLAASQCIENSLRQELSLEITSKCLEAIKLFCVAMVNTSAGWESGPWVSRLQSAWALYQTVASEKGATRFIGFLESNLSVAKKLPKTDTSLCSLRSIRSSEDVDDITRSLRFHILNALDKCLGFAPIHDPGLHDFATGEGLDVAAVFVARICREITQDLRIGLDGHSGGITTEMYESYLKAIQTCAAFIETISRRPDIELPFVTFHLLVDVVNNLRDILQSYSMQDAVLFRSTLIMAIAEFPSIIREGAKRHCDSLPPENMSEMLDELFEDCMSILKRWSAIRDPNAIPWEDIAGERHIGNADKLDTGSEYRKELRSVEIRFRGKELWSWALSCSFVAMETKWHEAFQAIVSIRQPSHRAMEDGFGQGTLSFLVQQRESLRSTIFRTATLFCSSTPQAYGEGQGAALDVLAMNLPSAPRLRFCHMLAAISKVLKYAIDHVGSCLRTESDGQQVKHKEQTKLSFLEAINTLEPWLRFDDTENEFAVGTFRWLSILRRKLSPDTQRTRYVDTAELLPWVSKVAALIRDLLSSLRKVTALFRHDDRLTVRGLEDVAQAVFPEGRHALSKLMTRKLTVLDTVVPSDYRSSSLPDFPTIPPHSTVAKAKRSRRQKSQLRFKKRAVIEVPKSRNSIVNAFMSLDRKSSENNDGDPDDAFVDLEDFLVEG